jgi:acetoin utilization deacetylase AcuC-like enzyme
MAVSLVYSPRYLSHNRGIEHPESSQRLAVLIRRLQNSPLKDYLDWQDPFEASDEDLLRVHTRAYINLIKTLSFMGGGWLDNDTFVSSASFNIATLAVGGAMRAFELAIENGIHSLALVRPPGHHASQDRGAGFCIFNNIACGVRYAQEKLGIEKVLIVDWDLHHGNGTQDIFYEDPSVLYFSLHQYPWYPGTGRIDEIGKEKGKGFTVNVPLPAGCGDEEYIKVCEEILPPLVRRFSPDLIAVSAGFDAHFADPLGGMFLSPFGYAYLTRILKQLNEELNKRGIVFLLEGGYNAEGLSASVEAVIGELMDVRLPISRSEHKASETVRSRVNQIISEVKNLHSL